jgi:hypothetical protein
VGESRSKAPNIATKDHELRRPKGQIDCLMSMRPSVFYGVLPGLLSPTRAEDTCDFGHNRSPRRLGSLDVSTFATLPG